MMASAKTPRFLKILALVLPLAALSALPARADAVLDFQLAGAAGGAINYLGGANPLTGSAIPIRLVASSGTPLNDNTVLSVTSGFLNFTTGNLISYAGGQMTFAGNGSFAITGAIPTIGINTISTLVNGSFLGASFNVNTGRSSLTLATGADVKHPTLVNYFFNAPPVSWIFSSTILAGVPTLGLNNAFAAPVRPTSVDIANTAVPEVGSILMLGTSLLATAYLVRRRSKKQA